MRTLFIGSYELIILALIILVPIVIVVMLVRAAAGRKPPAVDWQAQNALRASAEANAPAELGRVFDGRPAVIYDTRFPHSVSAPTAIAGAIERGYSLAHDAGGVLTFQFNGQQGQ